MKTLISTFLLLLIFPFLSQAQKNLNNYKYVLIPKQYNFQSTPDQYQLNSLTKFLFNKHGYTAFIEGDNLPEDLKSDNCKALNLYVNEEK